MDLLHLAINLSGRDVTFLFPRERDLATAGVGAVIGQERTSACVAAMQVSEHVPLGRNIRSLTETDFNLDFFFDIGGISREKFEKFNLVNHVTVSEGEKKYEC